MVIQKIVPPLAVSVAELPPFRMLSAGVVFTRFLGKLNIFPNFFSSGASEGTAVTSWVVGEAGYSAIDFRRKEII